MQGDPPNDLPIAYASRTVNRAESNYSTTEKELLAIIWSIKPFRPYIYGRKFVIITDYRPLTWLFNVKDLGSRLIRWRLTIEKYDYKILYKPGKLNRYADALSRISRNDISVQQIQIRDDLYTNFLNKMKTTFITNNNLEEVNSNFIDSMDNIVLCVSQNLEFKESIQLEIKNRFPLHFQNLQQKNLELNDIIKVSTQNKNIIFMITKIR